MIRLRAWSNKGKNPGGDNIDQAPVTISIGSEKYEESFVYPWVLPYETAVGMFGREVVDEIIKKGEEPVPKTAPITLRMELNE